MALWVEGGDESVGPLGIPPGVGVVGVAVAVVVETIADLQAVGVYISVGVEAVTVVGNVAGGLGAGLTRLVGVTEVVFVDVSVPNRLNVVDCSVAVVVFAVALVIVEAWVHLVVVVVAVDLHRGARFSRVVAVGINAGFGVGEVTISVGVGVCVAGLYAVTILVATVADNLGLSRIYGLPRVVAVAAHFHVVERRFARLNGFVVCTVLVPVVV